MTPNVFTQTLYVKTFTIPPFQGSDAGINRSEEDCTGSGTPGELSLLQSMEQSHLQDKLVDLQNKKQHMDQLLTELQALRSDKYAQIQNNRHIGELIRYRIIGRGVS